MLRNTLKRALPIAMLFLLLLYSKLSQADQLVLPTSFRSLEALDPSARADAIEYFCQSLSTSGSYSQSQLCMNYVTRLRQLLATSQNRTRYVLNGFFEYADRSIGINAFAAKLSDTDDKKIWIIVDLTNPLDYRMSGQYVGAGKTDTYALANAIIAWHNACRYPQGTMRVLFVDKGIKIGTTFETPSRFVSDAMTELRLTDFPIIFKNPEDSLNSEPTVFYSMNGTLFPAFSLNHPANGSTYPLNYAKVGVFAVEDFVRLVSDITSEKCTRGASFVSERGRIHRGSIWMSKKDKVQGGLIEYSTSKILSETLLMPDLISRIVVIADKLAKADKSKVLVFRDESHLRRIIRDNFTIAEIRDPDNLIDLNQQPGWAKWQATARLAAKGLERASWTSDGCIHAERALSKKNYVLCGTPNGNLISFHHLGRAVYTHFNDEIRVQQGIVLAAGKPIGFLPLDDDSLYGKIRLSILISILLLPSDIAQTLRDIISFDGLLELGFSIIKSTIRAVLAEIFGVGLLDDLWRIYSIAKNSVALLKRANAYWSQIKTAHNESDIHAASLQIRELAVSAISKAIQEKVIKKVDQYLAQEDEEILEGKKSIKALPSYSIDEEKTDRLILDSNENFRLTESNAAEALMGPSGSASIVQGSGVPGADILFTDKSGALVLRREVKCISVEGAKFANRFIREFSDGASQIQYQGEVFIQVKSGITYNDIVDALHSTLPRYRSAADVDKFRKVMLKVKDADGNTLYYRQVDYDLPGEGQP